MFSFQNFTHLTLRRIILEYYNINRLLRESSLVINKAFLRDEYSKFSFSIVVFC